MGEGYNEYNQAANCRGWETAIGKDGNTLLDPEGYPLKQLVNTLPGTVTCAYRFRVIYQTLKKHYKRRLHGTDENNNSNLEKEAKLNV